MSDKCEEIHPILGDTTILGKGLHLVIQSLGPDRVSSTTRRSQHLWVERGVANWAWSFRRYQVDEESSSEPVPHPATVWSHPPGGRGRCLDQRRLRAFQSKATGIHLDNSDEQMYIYILCKRCAGTYGMPPKLKCMTLYKCMKVPCYGTFKAKISHQ